MSDSNHVDLTPIKEKLEKAGSIFVLFGQQATVDHVAAALSLYLVLKDSNKDVSIASPAELRAEFSRLVGLDKITTTIGNRNLVISFGNYDPGSIEKVSATDAEGSKFELIIQPKAGRKAPDPTEIEYSFRGAEADLIFLIGTARLEDLGPIYEKETKLFHEATIVAFNRRQPTNFATINVTDNQASSLCEIIADFVEKIGFESKGDIASNLLSGIDFSTNRFQNPVIPASAFLLAGKLLQQGARRQPPRVATGGPSTYPGQNPFMPFQPPQPPPFATSQPPASPGVPQQAPPATQPPSSQPPKDWLEPKIYKGSSRV